MYKLITNRRTDTSKGKPAALSFVIMAIWCSALSSTWSHLTASQNVGEFKVHGRRSLEHSGQVVFLLSLYTRVHFDTLWYSAGQSKLLFFISDGTSVALWDHPNLESPHTFWRSTGLHPVVLFFFCKCQDKSTLGEGMSVNDEKEHCCQN